MDRKKPQVPPLRYAPVGMTNSRVAPHLGMGRGDGHNQPTKVPTYSDCPLTLDGVNSAWSIDSRGLERWAQKAGDDLARFISVIAGDNSVVVDAGGCG
jgi:hypothetical protein